MAHSPRPRHVGLKVIGVLKLLSGATAVAVGIGVFRFLDHDPGPPPSASFLTWASIPIITSSTR